MGIFNKLFGGASMTISLDSDRVHPGGQISGSLEIASERKNLDIETIRITLRSTLVHPPEDAGEDAEAKAAMPRLDTVTLLEETIAENIPLPVSSRVTREFSLTIPADAPPSGDGRSYKILVATKIPRAAGPRANVTITVIAD